MTLSVPPSKTTEPFTNSWTLYQSAPENSPGPMSCLLNSGDGRLLSFHHQERSSRWFPLRSGGTPALSTDLRAFIGTDSQYDQRNSIQTSA